MQGVARIACRRTRLLHRRRSWFLSLSQVWRTHEGHRKAHRCRDPISISTADQNLLHETTFSNAKTLRASARSVSLWLSAKNLFLAASSTTVFAMLCRRSQFPSAPRDGLCPAALPRRTPNSSLPQLNLHSARVHRNHGRPRPNGFTGHAENFPPPLTP